MSTTPQYIGAAKSPSVAISTANTNRDGTGTLGTLHTAGANGARIDRIRVQALATTTAGMIRFFNGSSLIQEVPVIAQTPSGTTPAWAVDLDFDKGLILQAGALLKVGTNNAESFAVTVIAGGDF